jgi:comEA protein
MRYWIRCFAVVALMVGLLGGSTVWGDHHEATAKVNINTADATALEGLPGVGPAKAKAIVEYRSQNGPFKAVSDLEKVSGVGPKIVDRLKEKVTVGGEQAPN